MNKFFNFKILLYICINKEIMKDITLYTDNKGLEGIEFSMGEYRKLIGVESLIRMKESISEYIKYVEHWSYMKKLYSDYDFNKELENSKDYEDGLYHVGHQLQSFLDVDVEEYIKSNFEHYSELDLDVTSDFCYTYIKDENVAREYIKFCYDDIIKPCLDKI